MWRFFFERTFECSNEDIFRRKRRGVYKCTYRPAGNNRTAKPTVSLSNVAFSVLAHDSLPDTCTATSPFFFRIPLGIPPLPPQTRPPHHPPYPAHPPLPFSSLRSTDGSLCSTRGPLPAPPLNNKTPAVATDRLVYAPSCVWSAKPSL